MKGKNGSILVIDRQSYWRELAAGALHAAGYFCATIADYNDALLLLQNKQIFALIVFGCAVIDVEEYKQIIRLITFKQHVLVQTSNTLSAQEMRALFRQGVEDASDKTYDPVELVDIVEQALERIHARDMAQFSLERDIYHE